MRVLIIGDSQAAGPPGEITQQELEAQGHRVLRDGIVGHGPVDFLTMHRDDTERLVREFRPDRILFMFGSNDAPTHPRFDEAIRWLMNLGDAYYSGPPQYDNAARRMIGAEIRQRVSSLIGRRYIDVWEATKTPQIPPGRLTAMAPQYYAGDGVHMNRMGARAWAEVVVPRIVARGSILVVGAATLAAAFVGIFIARRVM